MGNESGLFTEWTIHVDVKLREYVSPMFIPGRNDLKSMGTISRFASEGSILRNSIRCRNQYMNCSGEGTATITGGLVDNPTPAAIYRKTTDDPMMAALGFDVPRGQALYFVGVASDNSQTFEVTYRSHETSVSSSRFVTLIGGRAPEIPLLEFSDLEYRYLEGGAMIGSFSRTLSSGDSQISVSWSICPEDISCPQAPPLPEGGSSPPDPCARAGQVAAQRDTCRSQLDAKLEALGPALAEYNDLMKVADENREAFEKAQQYCAYYDKAVEVLEAILSGGAGPAAEAARSLVYLRGLIQRVQSGDIASMLIPTRSRSSSATTTRQRRSGSS